MKSTRKLGGCLLLLLPAIAPDTTKCSLMTSSVVVPDCNCTVETVDKAIQHFISPILVNLTSQAFFRYFKVDLGRPCPYWKEDGQCVMEGCSVCTCDESEVPKAWLKQTSSNTEVDSRKAPDYGWIASLASNYGYDGRGHDDSLGRITSPFKDEEDSIRRQEQVQIAAMAAREPSDRYTDVYGQRIEGLSGNNRDSNAARYVNLLKNPESFTGYSGPSARRVWRAIQEENCFGDQSSSSTEQCLEKRVFYRLLSGLQASISTHIARQYLHTDSGRWGPNLQLYWSAVGRHPDRLNSMYFTFLFLLRSVVRAKDFLLRFPYVTGVDADDGNVAELLRRLLLSGQTISAAGSPVEDCHRAFDESELFQVSELLTGRQYWSRLEEKQALRMEFMGKFNNISSIMDCVSCEKCRLWGKLQILGIRSAIKILLTPLEELDAFQSKDLDPAGSTCSTSEAVRKGVLGRDEVIALVNTLNQFSNSLLFAAEASAEEVEASSS